MGCVGYDCVGLSEHPFITPVNCKAFWHRFYSLRINSVYKVVVFPYVPGQISQNYSKILLHFPVQ